MTGFKDEYKSAVLIEKHVDVLSVNAEGVAVKTETVMTATTSRGTAATKKS